MNDLFIYAVKVNASLVVFYLFYKLFFQRDTFWNLRRSYLLVATLFSFIFPFISMQEWLSRQQPVITTLAAIPLDEFVVGPTESSAPGFFTLGNVLTLIFAVVLVLFLLHTFIQFLSILRQRIRGEKTELMGVEIIRMLEKLNPFSFFKWIFINPEQHDEQETSEILEHELTHVREWHSIDVVLAQVMRALCWINPAAWLLEYEIRLNLEFLADNAVIRSGVEPKKYQYHLLTLTYEPADSKLANNFNILPLKKRIKMMNTKKTKRTGLLKYALVAPLALALLLVSNMQDLMASAKNFIDANIVSEQLADTQDPVISIKSIETDKKSEKTEPQKGEEAAQENNELKNNELSTLMVTAYGPNDNSEPEDIEYFDTVDKAPQFPGGVEAMYSWLARNVNYPVRAQEMNKEGNVVVQFIVGADGKVTRPVILRSVDSALDSEAIRVVSEMPTWIPGENKGKKVNVRYTLPIMFKLQGNRTLGKVVPNTSDRVFDIVEQAPSFPGGNDAMYKWLGENIKYPGKAIEERIQGRVTLQVIIAPDGTVTEPRVVRGVDPLLDAEALRVVNAMPKWIPGKQGGKAVNVRYILPVNFRLSDDKNQAVDSKKETVATENSNASGKVFEIVEKAPSFPGGEDAMYKWLGENIKYPAEAKKERIQGRVVVQMIIGVDGTVTNPEIVRGVDPLLDAEAIRVMNAMPKWIPGKQGRNAVKVRYTIPLTFKLDDKDEKVTAQTENLKLRLEENQSVLVVVDGVEFDKTILDKIKSEDIESVSVLKDKSATQIYGEKGKDGVIIITTKKSVLTKPISKSTVYDKVDQAPSFPGGVDALRKWLGENTIYPKEAHENNIKGRVVSQFTVTAKGEIKDVEVINSVDKNLDAEALRVIAAMPQWIPGKHQGKNVDVRYTFPLTFSLH